MCFSVKVPLDLETILSEFSATICQQSQDSFERLRLHPDYAKKVKLPGEDGRLYPNYWSWVLVAEGEKMRVKRMRYRIRPAGTPKEIPSKYNLFNARSDSLTSRQTWRGLFGRNHGLFPFLSFYEWVRPSGAKRPQQINFFPKGAKLMWAPVLFDRWTDPQQSSLSFESFALITQGPPPEILAQGHDRCPIFLARQAIGSWLHPEKLSQQEMHKVLKQTTPTYFEHQWVV